MLPKTESRSSKECEFSESESLDEELVSQDEIFRRSHLPRLDSNFKGGLAKLTASLLTNLGSLKSLANLLLLAVEAFREIPNLPFSEEWLKREYTSREKATEKAFVTLWPLALWPYGSGPMAPNSCLEKFWKIDRISHFFIFFSATI